MNTTDIPADTVEEGGQKSPLPHGPRRKFLVLVDGTPESEAALHFASRRALHTGGGVTLLCVIEPGGFQHWLGVDAIMKEEAREEAGAILHRLSARVNAVAGTLPELVIREGKKSEQIRALIAEDRDVAVLVLGAGAGREGPGPLVSMVAAGAENMFPVPVTVVPGSFSIKEINALA